MKKFISMVMAAAMVVSLVPATAFAATGSVEADGTAKVIDSIDLVEDYANDMGTPADESDDVDGFIDASDAPVVRIKLDSVESADGTFKQEIKYKLDGAKFVASNGQNIEDYEDENSTALAERALLDLINLEGNAVVWNGSANVFQTTGIKVTVDKFSNSAVTFVIEGSAAALQNEIDTNYNDDINLVLATKLNKVNAGAEAKVTVTTDIEGAEKADMVYATVEGKGFTAELEDDVVDVAPEEDVTAEIVVLEPAVGDFFSDIADADDKVKLSLSKGFEFHNDMKTSFVIEGVDVTGNTDFEYDDDKISFEIGSTLLAKDEIELDTLKIVADDAKAGDECTLTIKIGSNDAVKVVIAKVVESGLTISVDEDEDVPVMWSGVNAKNQGLTTGADEHQSLEITIKETFEEAYDNKDEIELVLPEGVYVVDPDDTDASVNGVTITDADGVVTTGTWNDAKIVSTFASAYNEGDYKSFVFKKNAFPESTVGSDNAIEFSFELTLVADPGFVGEVPVTMLVDGEEVGEVVVAKFETPMIIAAEQNDLKIDYRNTAVGTDIVVTEAEAGLWDETLKVQFGIDEIGADTIGFEDDATYTVNEDESGMEIKTKSNEFGFSVKEESDDAAAVVTISDIELYMSRNLPAGAYDLVMAYTLNGDDDTCYDAQVIFGSEDTTHTTDAAWTSTHDEDHDKVGYVGDVTDYSDVAKEAWINIVTAGREQDDASFTTKVVVPVGEAYIIAGEQTVALDVPAYVSAAGYTMLPVRAVATALGINNNNVLWDQATKTVTILYGQRIITMTVGAKVINVNGSAIPASASVEVVNGRTFLPMRDLATALGVTDITWDAATKTATLNGNI